MPTDNERREVANKLRERTKHKLAKGESMQHMFSKTLGVYRTYDYGSLGLVKESETWKNIVNLLADLIEPEPERTCHLVEDEDGHTACSECGCTALYMSDATYCPDCGAKVVK